MREFKVSTTPETGVEFTKEVIRTQDGWAPYQGEESNLIDENTQTSIWYNVRQNGNPANTTIKGDYVGVKLSQPITLGKIDILQGKNDNDGDYFKNVKLQYSVNGTDWKDIPGVEPFKKYKTYSGRSFGQKHRGTVCSSGKSGKSGELDCFQRI